MDPLTLGLIMAGIGATKYAAVDKPKEDRKRKLAAETQRYSPWTGLQAGPVEEADLLGNAMQFGATGAAMGSNMQQADTAQKLAQAQTGYFDAMSKGAASSQPPAIGISANPQQSGLMSSYWDKVPQFGAWQGVRGYGL